MILDYKNNVIQFYELKVNDLFFNDIELAKWPYEKDIYRYKLYKKIDKAFAICIGTKGYGNKRHIGDENPFSPVSLVYKITIIINLNK